MLFGLHAIEGVGLYGVGADGNDVVCCVGDAGACLAGELERERPGCYDD